MGHLVMAHTTGTFISNAVFGLITILYALTGIRV